MVPQAGRRFVPARTYQNRCDLVPLQNGRHAFIGVKPRRQNMRRQVRSNEPCPMEITQQRVKPLRCAFQRTARQFRGKHVHIAVDVADAHFHEAFGSASFQLPAQEVSGLPQERVDARPSKTTLLAKPGFVFVADRKPQCVGGAGYFWSRWPPILHKSQQCVTDIALPRLRSHLRPEFLAALNNRETPVHRRSNFRSPPDYIGDCSVWL